MTFLSPCTYHSEVTVPCWHSHKLSLTQGITHPGSNEPGFLPPPCKSYTRSRVCLSGFPSEFSAICTLGLLRVSIGGHQHRRGHKQMPVPTPPKTKWVAENRECFVQGWHEEMGQRIQGTLVKPGLDPQGDPRAGRGNSSTPSSPTL